MPALLYADIKKIKPDQQLIIYDFVGIPLSKNLLKKFFTSCPNDSFGLVSIISLPFSYTVSYVPLSLELRKVILLPFL